MPSYNARVVTDLITQALDDGPRGGANRLAEAMKVTPQTVSKWRGGQVCPEPDKWADIETHLGMGPGTLARASGLRGFIEAAEASPSPDPDGEPWIAHMGADPDLPEAIKQAIIDIARPYKGQNRSGGQP